MLQSLKIPFMFTSSLEKIIWGLAAGTMGTSCKNKYYGYGKNEGNRA
ncbi:MAG: hypothetical protein H7Y01_02400 [Ferruginibacter sp.]|nr:hypothetical protein [Chitinophagaceae bacterium]